jgi:AraC-like DNA-binding protein
VQVRPPRARALAWWVEQVWVAERPADAPEWLIPTGAAHVVWRLDAPVRLSRAPGPDGDAQIEQIERFGALAGASDVGHRHDRPASRSIGVTLRPGAVAALFGVPASEVARRHVGLADLLGADAISLHDALASAPSDTALDLVEAFLAARAPLDAGPPLGPALRRLDAGASVREAAAAVGRTPRTLGSWFEQAIGLSPRVWARVRRLGRALARDDGRTDASTLAFAAGFADQAHLCREMRGIASMSFGDWRDRRTAAPHHVRLPIRSSGGPATP